MVTNMVFEIAQRKRRDAETLQSQQKEWHCRWRDLRAEGQAQRRHVGANRQMRGPILLRVRQERTV